VRFMERVNLDGTVTSFIEKSAYDELQAQADHLNSELIAMTQLCAKHLAQAEKLAEALDNISGIDLFDDHAIAMRFKGSAHEDLIEVICQDTKFARDALKEWLDFSLKSNRSKE
jgi:hypothetical protein